MSRTQGQPHGLEQPPHFSAGFGTRGHLQVLPVTNPSCLAALTRNPTLFSGLFPHRMQAAGLEQNNVPVNTAKDTSLPVTTWLLTFFSPLTFFINYIILLLLKKPVDWSCPRAGYMGGYWSDPFTLWAPSQLQQQQNPRLIPYPTLSANEPCWNMKDFMFLMKLRGQAKQ